jgi:hypothetical protein
MHLTTLPVDVPSRHTLEVLDIGTIFGQFQTLPDGRKRRGIRYLLAVLLTIALLAKLAGYSKARAIADWARLRAAALAHLFDLPRVTMPH